MQSAKQMKKIVEKTYPKLYFGDEVQEDMHCGTDSTSGEPLACKWQKVVQIMSSTATIHPKMRVNYLYSVRVYPLSIQGNY